MYTKNSVKNYAKIELLTNENFCNSKTMMQDTMTNKYKQRDRQLPLIGIVDYSNGLSIKAETPG